MNEGNYQISFDAFKPLAEQGNAKAQFHLGFLYRIGQVVEQDYQQAYHWYLLSAEQGYAVAQSVYNISDLNISVSNPSSLPESYMG